MGFRISKDKLLYREVLKGNQDRVKSLHRDGASLEWMDKEGRTPLILACTRGGLLKMAITLINLGANIHIYKPGFYGGTLLHLASRQGLDRTVKMLLSCGANPLAINDHYKTPLDMARASNHVTVVRIIEGQISLFCGMLRELCGYDFVEAIGLYLQSKKIYAVVLPSMLDDSTRPPKYELVIYHTREDSQPRTIISLSEVVIKEPKFGLPDPVLVLLDRGTGRRYKFLSVFEGDKPQLHGLYEACKGIQIPQNGWAADEARPSRSNTAETLTNNPTLSRPSATPNSVNASVAVYAPSAPPLPAENVPFFS